MAEKNDSKSLYSQLEPVEKSITGPPTIIPNRPDKLIYKIRGGTEEVDLKSDKRCKYAKSEDILSLTILAYCSLQETYWETRPGAKEAKRSTRKLASCNKGYLTCPPRCYINHYENCPVPAEHGLEAGD